MAILVAENNVAFQGGLASVFGGDHRSGCPFNSINAVGSPGQYGKRGGGIVLLTAKTSFTMVETARILANGGRGARGNF